MKELRSGKGRFERFKDNLSLQTDLFRRLHDVLGRLAPLSFGAFVVIRDYDTIDQEFMLHEHQGPPVMLAAAVAVDRMLKWLKAHDADGEWAYMFDQGMKSFAAISDLLFAKHALRPAPGVPARVPGLQAADMIAWDNHRAMNAVLAADYGRVKFRGSFDSLIAKLGGEQWMVLHDESLRIICRDGHIPFRQR